MYDLSLTVVAFLQEPPFTNDCTLTGWAIVKFGKDFASLSWYNFALCLRSSIVSCTFFELLALAMVWL